MTLELKRTMVQEIYQIELLHRLLLQSQNLVKKQPMTTLKVVLVIGLMVVQMQDDLHQILNMRIQEHMLSD